MPVEVENKMKDIIAGKIKYTSANLGMNMLISRLSKKYAATPTAATLAETIEEVKTFFGKYATLAQKEFDLIKQA